MIGKHYKKDEEQEKKGQEWVLKGAQIGFKRLSKWDFCRFEDLERIRMAPRHLSRSFKLFFTVSPLSSPVFTILAKNGKKDAVKTCLNGNGKKAFVSHFFPVPFFTFPFLVHVYFKINISYEVK